MTELTVSERHGVQIRSLNAFKLECDVEPLAGGRVRWGLHRAELDGRALRQAVLAAGSGAPAVDLRLTDGAEIALLDREVRVRDHSRVWDLGEHWATFTSYVVRAAPPTRRRRLLRRPAQQTVTIGPCALTGHERYRVCDVLWALDAIGR